MSKIAFEGGIFNGELNNGLPNGIGTLTLGNKDKISGSWDWGELLSGTYKFFGQPEGRIEYVGQFKNRLFHGSGKLYSKTKEYDGQWEYGKMKFAGKTTFLNGDFEESFIFSDSFGIIRRYNHYNMESEYGFIERNGIEYIVKINLLISEKLGEKVMNDAIKKNILPLWNEIKMNSDMACRVLSWFGRCLIFIPEDERNEKFLLAAIRSYANALVLAEEKYKTDEALVRKILEINGKCLEFVDKSFREKEEFCLLAISTSGKYMNSVIDKFRENPKITGIIVTAMRSGLPFRDVPNSLKKQKEILQFALKHQCLAMVFDSLPENYLEKDDFTLIHESFPSRKKNPILYDLYEKSVVTNVCRLESVNWCDNETLKGKFYGVTKHELEKLETDFFKNCYAELKLKCKVALSSLIDDLSSYKFESHHEDIFGLTFFQEFAFLGSRFVTQRNLEIKSEDVIPRHYGYNVILKENCGKYYCIGYINFTSFKIGCFENNVKKILYSGRGSLYYEKIGKLQYYGDLKNSLYDGIGYQFDEKNDTFPVYEGEFQNGLRNGKGERYDLQTSCFFDVEYQKGKEIRSFDKNNFKCDIVDFSKIKNYLKPKHIIGEGSNGIIYEVKARKINSISKKEIIPNSSKIMVAVKMFKRETLSDFGIRNRMSTSIRAAVRICKQLLLNNEDENILIVRCVIEGEGELGYIMDLGKHSVVDAIRDENFLLDERVRLLHEVARGMRGLHRLDIMHRDLKWGNVLISFDGKALITDIDTIKEDRNKYKVYKDQHSIQGIGTACFLAPEIYLENEFYDKSVDIYSFGLMMYSLLFKSPDPFHVFTNSNGINCTCNKKVNIESVCDHAANCQLRPILNQKKRDEIPLEHQYLLGLIQKCWKQESSRRPNFEEIVKIFEDRGVKYCFAQASCRIENTFSAKQMPMSKRIILTEPTVQEIESLVDELYPRNKILSLSFFNQANIRCVLSNDEDVQKMLDDKDFPEIIVCLEKMPVSKGELVEVACEQKLEKLKRVNEEQSLELEDMKKKIESLCFSLNLEVADKKKAEKEEDLDQGDGCKRCGKLKKKGIAWKEKIEEMKKIITTMEEKEVDLRMKWENMSKKE